MTPQPGRRALIRDAVAIGIATGAYGLSFGAVAVTAGLSVAETSALSLLMFTGASQFAFVASLASGGAWAGAATAALLGTRNAFYGLRLSPILPPTRGRRIVAAQLVIDESTAMAVSRDDPDEARVAFWATGTAVFVCWNLATLIGAVGARALSDPRTLGLDAAAPAAFVALLAPRLRSPLAAALALTCAVVALAATPLTPNGVPVLAAAVVVLVTAARTTPTAGRGGGVTWWAILVACMACYAAKLIGVSVPARVLADRRIAHAAGLLPIGLLAALVATQTFTNGHHLAIDARAAGLAVAVAAQARRAPFIVVVAAAVATTAIVRAVA